MHPSPSILQAEEISFGFLQQPLAPLFDKLSFVLPPGVTLVCGGEGSGKTTLLRLLAGDLPENGLRAKLHIKGVSLTQNRLAYLRQLAWLDPRDAALDGQTARQIFAGLPPKHPDFDADALQAHIGGLSLAPHLDKTLSMMSSGTRRKVFLAAALASGAAVTLLDQPFMALDRPSIDYLLALLGKAARHPDRAWVLADYEAPPGVALSTTVALPA